MIVLLDFDESYRGESMSSIECYLQSKWEAKKANLSPPHPLILYVIRCT